MFDNGFTDFNRNDTNGLKMCMKSCYSSKNGSTLRQNGAVTYRTSKNGNRLESKVYSTNHWNDCTSLQNKFRENTWDDDLPCPVVSFPKACILTFTVAVLCFVTSLNGNFVFDDSEAIINNVDVQLNTPISSLFLHDFWGTKISSNSSHKSFRPLTVLSFRLNHWLHGSLEPQIFHLTNIILHALVSVFVLQLFAIILSSSSKHWVYSFNTAYKYTPKASLMCAILFASHPIHSESVAGVVGRADLLCAICFLLSFFSYVKACSSSGIWTCVMMLLHLLFSLMSLICKEQGITVLGLCVVYDIIVVHEINILDVMKYISFKSSYSQDANIKPRNNRSLVFRIALLICSAIIMLSGRWYIMGGSTPSFQRVDNPASFMDSMLLRAINYNYIYSINLWLLIHPLWLCFDWSMGCIPLITSLLDSRMVLIFTFWIVIATMIYSMLFVVCERYKKLLVMSAAFIIIPFLPASNVFFRVGFVIAERALYLPSLGYCLLIVLGLRQICQLFSRNQLQFMMCILLVSFTTKCVQRCSEWNNEKVLFQSGLKVCPLNAKVHYNIAKTAADSGDKNTAVLQYSEAIKLNPDYDQALNNLANILKDNGQLNEAERLLLSAIYIRPDFAAAWMNLGIVQASLHKHNKAEQSYLIALSHRKRYPDCLYNLGNLYLEMKRYDDAYRVWRNATILKPTQTAAWNNMVIMLDSIGNLEKAVEVAQEALFVLPGEASLHFNFANTLGKLNQYKESESHFIKAIKLKSNNPTYYTNLGVLYHRWKKFDKAEKAYQMALKINQNSRSAIDNLELLRKQLNKNKERS